jgi:transcriptional regulator with XRE-family HTH domain
MKNIAQIVGGNIKKLRKSNEMNQTEFAKILGVTTAYVSSLERGDRLAPSKTLIFLAEHFGVGLGYFYPISEKDDKAQKVELLRKMLEEAEGAS